MEAIGAHKNIVKCLNLIDVDGASPVLNWHGVLWYIHTHERALGNLMATVFSNADTPMYTIRTPFSLGKTLGELLYAATNLRAHELPFIDHIPEELIPIV